MCREILPRSGRRVDYHLVRSGPGAGELDLGHLASLTGARTRLVCGAGRRISRHRQPAEGDPGDGRRQRVPGSPAAVRRRPATARPRPRTPQPAPPRRYRGSPERRARAATARARSARRARVIASRTPATLTRTAAPEPGTASGHLPWSGAPLAGRLSPLLRTPLPRSGTAFRILFQDLLARRPQAIRQRDGSAATALRYLMPAPCRQAPGPDRPPRP